MKVRDIMTSQLATGSRATTLAAAAQLLWRADCGILPVVEDGKLVGVATDRDMYIAVATRNTLPSYITLGDIATGVVWTCSPDDDVHTALDMMKTRRVRRLPVTDASGALVGILSMNDIVLAAGADKPVSAEEVVDTLKAICVHGAAPSVAAA